MIDDDAVATQHDSEFAVTESPMTRREFAQAIEYLRINDALYAIPNGTTSAANDFAGTLLAYAFGLERPHRGFPLRGPQPFFSTSNL